MQANGQVRAIKIDHAAGGLLRHRFMRALSGGVLVLAAFLALIFAGVFGAAFVVLYFNEITGNRYTVGDVVIAGLAAAAVLGLIWTLHKWLGPRIGEHLLILRGAFGRRRWREFLVRLAMTALGLAVFGFALVFVAERLVLAGGFALLAVVVLAVVLLALVTIVLTVAMAGALLQGFWFRLLPLLGFLSFSAMIIIGVFVFATAFLAVLPPELIIILIVSGIGLAIVGLELFGQTLWQLFANNRGFFAARGWRPPIYWLITTTRRHMGLPGFLANVPKARAKLTLLYMGVALCNALSVTALLAPAVIAFLLGFAEVDASRNPTSPPLAATLGVCAVGWAMSYGFFRLARWLSRLADEQVVTIYQSVREWDARPPIVFLRSFSQDDDRLPPRSIDPFLTRLAGVAQPQTMDELLLEHASPYGPVIAIGDPRTTRAPLGAARIFVRSEGNEWQGVVTELVQASSAVIMCPTTTEGVRWELKLVEHGDYRKRTIYLANPEISEADSRKLFEAMMPAGTTLVMHRKKTPIAAFHCAKLGWTVLCANKRSLQTYTVGLNYALQSVLGRQGSPLLDTRRTKMTAAQSVKLPIREAESGEPTAPPRGPADAGYWQGRAAPDAATSASQPSA